MFMVVYFVNTVPTRPDNTSRPSGSDAITAIPASECTLFDLCTLNFQHTFHQRPWLHQSAEVRTSQITSSPNRIHSLATMTVTGSDYNTTILSLPYRVCHVHVYRDDCSDDVGTQLVCTGLHPYVVACIVLNIVI